MDTAIKMMVSTWMRRLILLAAGAAGWEAYLSEDITTALVAAGVTAVSVLMKWVDNKLNPVVPVKP